MGQRLNFEVCYDGKVIANAYYHWGAYTGSAIALLGHVIEAYDDRKEINPLRVAVEILQATRAGVNNEEQQRISADKSGRFDNIEFKDAIDRNHGLLSVTEEGIEETRSWEEGRVSVDISTEDFVFGVMWEMSNDEFDDDCGREPWSSEKLQKVDFDFRNPCPFSDFEKFAEIVADNPVGVRIDDDTTLCWIE